MRTVAETNTGAGVEPVATAPAPKLDPLAHTPLDRDDGTRYAACLPAREDRPVRLLVSSTRNPERVGQLRRIGAAHLRLWGLSACVETSKLLISELVTNAVRYGKADEIGFSLSYWKGEVRIEVDDHSPGRPYLKQPCAEDESGRGMYLVDALCDDWGTSPDGTRTWCIITVPDGVTG